MLLVYHNDTVIVSFVWSSSVNGLTAAAAA